MLQPKCSYSLNEQKLTTVKNQICKHCKAVFKYSWHCKRHERIHTGEKPYKSRHCNKRFLLAWDCKRHELTHTGEKPFKGKHCNKHYRQNLDCKAHVENTQVCKYCGRCFIRSSRCKQHERAHTGERRYVCEHCSQAISIRRLSSVGKGPDYRAGGRGFEPRPDQKPGS